MTEQSQKVLKPELINASHISPLAVCAMWDAIPPYKWQAETIRKLFVQGSRIMVSTPNEAGKTSWLVSNAGLACMTMFPGCEVVSTAGVFRQVSQQLWPVVRAKVNPHPKWSCTDELLKAPSVNGLPPSRWSIFSSADDEKAEGYHSRNYKDKDGNIVYAPLLYIIDEAKSVDDGIFKAMYRCDPDFVLVVSTPGEEAGTFFNTIDTFMRNKEAGITQSDVGVDWQYIKVGWNDCPHLLEPKKRKTREQLIKQYGVKNPFIQSMIFGNFYRSGGYFIYNSTNVKTCMAGTIMHTPGDKAAAVDLAGGGDEVVFGLRIGNKCTIMETRVDRDTAATSRWLESLFIKHQLRPEQITIDEGGMGQPIVDELEVRGWLGIQRYNFDGKPISPNRYQSVGMEDAHNLSILIDQCSIVLPKDDDLYNQARKRKYTLPNSNGGIMTLESKKALRKRGEPSPDRLDMLQMLFKDVLPNSNVTIVQATQNMFPERFMKYMDSESDDTMYGMRSEQ